MVWILGLAGFVFGVVFGGFCSGSETGLYTLNRVRLRLRREQGEPSALRLSRLVENEQSTLFVVLIGTTVADYIATAAVAYMLVRGLGFATGASDGHAAVTTELYTTLIVTPFVFVFGEAVPKNLYRQDADRLMYPGSLPLTIFNRLLRATGVVWLLQHISGWLVRRVDPKIPQQSPFEPRRQIAALLREALSDQALEAGGQATSEHSELIDRVLKLSATQAQHVMIPRGRVIGLWSGAGRDEVRAVATRSPYTRLPVFDERRERVLGVVHILELLDALAAPAQTPSSRDASFSILRFVKPALMLDPTESVAAVIIRMQRSRQKIAIVATRTGRMLGLLTLKDLLEEVVGDLRAW